MANDARHEGSTRPLREVQQWFQAVITSPGGVPDGLTSDKARSFVPLIQDELESMVTRSRHLSATQRLSIYANAYYARLVECLGAFFPVLRLALGKEIFDDFAIEYLQRYPSRSYTLDRLGDHFVGFLTETRPDRDADGNPPPSPSWPDFLIDLARLEQTIGLVFDGPGVEGGRVLTDEDLSELSPEQFGRVGLETAPCLTLLDLRFPLNDYYTFARRAAQDEPAPPMPSPAHTHLAITRRDFIVRRYALTPAQHSLLMALQEGATVAEAIAAAASTGELQDDASERLSSWFRDWAAAGCFFVRVVG